MVARLCSSMSTPATTSPISSFSSSSQPSTTSQMSSSTGYSSTPSSSISSARTISSNNEYKMVDLDIPPFLRRNKD